MLVLFNKKLLEIYIFAKHSQPLAVHEVTIRLAELRDQILTKHCLASLQAYNRYVRLISLYLPGLNSQLRTLLESRGTDISTNTNSLWKYDTQSLVNFNSFAALTETYERPNYLDIDWLESQLARDPSRYDLLVWLARGRLQQGRFVEGRALLHRVAASRYREAALAQYFLSRMILEAAA